MARIDNLPGVRMVVYKQSGQNTVEVVEGVYKELKRLEEDYPQFKFIPIRDGAKYIRDAINNVGSSVFYGGLLAIFVLLFSLVDIRSTLVIAISIPIFVIATSILIYFNGFTLNVMSLGGLALGTGMMVDSSIVVLENIYRLREGCMPIMKAGVEGQERLPRLL